MGLDRPGRNWHARCSLNRHDAPSRARHAIVVRGEHATDGRTISVGTGRRSWRRGFCPRAVAAADAGSPGSATPRLEKPASPPLAARVVGRAAPPTRRLSERHPDAAEPLGRRAGEALRDAAQAHLADGVDAVAELDPRSAAADERRAPPAFEERALHEHRAAAAAHERPDAADPPRVAQQRLGQRQMTVTELLIRPRHRRAELDREAVRQRFRSTHRKRRHLARSRKIEVHETGHEFDAVSRDARTGTGKILRRCRRRADDEKSRQRNCHDQSHC